MISKKEFVDIINKLTKVNDFVNEINDRARELDDAIVSDFCNAMSLSISHEGIVVDLLENMFNDTDTLSWWLYECDYGRTFKMGNMTVNGKPVDLTTTEKLYDYLLEGENNEGR